MGRLAKILIPIFLLLLLAVCSLVLLSPRQLGPFSIPDTSPDPSIPEFHVSATDNSYYVPAFGHVDLNTGQFDKYPAHFVRNGSIGVNIENQPFKGYYDYNGYNIQLYYHIRVRGHGTDDWYYYPVNNPELYFVADNSSYTKVLFTYQGNEFKYCYNESFAFPSLNELLDFQVEAFIGHINATSQSLTQYFDTIRTNSSTPHNLSFAYVGQASGWSKTQTIAIPPSTAYVLPTAAP
ncbi:MAG: hypothetical protein NWE92_07500 [Candidatus Bathyarchaeota archaeon]|nr:hypothetical protein [Candidatus Bathyarchaeota archaeon]